MKTDDLILVSIDDHVVEPPDMFLRHVPAKYRDDAPVVVTDDKGVDRWIYQGKPQGVSGLNAVVSWPAEEWGRDPAGFAEMRPGVYDVHERVRDMNRNGILASMCFPTFTGFSRPAIMLLALRPHLSLLDGQVNRRLNPPASSLECQVDCGSRLTGELLRVFHSFIK